MLLARAAGNREGAGRAGAALVGSNPVPAIQAKLAINQPGDEFEREADHISEQVMRMPEPRPALCACAGTCPKCRRGQSDAEHSIQAKRLPTGGAGAVVAPPIVHQVLDSSGQSLDPGTRRFMEQRFGYDFGRIRIHANTAAAKSADAVQARAYTVGAHIVFGAGRYAPSDTAGRLLLAHELVHTLQQGAVADSVAHPSAGPAPSLARTLQRQPAPQGPQPCPPGQWRLGPSLPCAPRVLPGRQCPLGEVKLSPDAPCVPLRSRPELLPGKLHLDPTLGTGLGVNPRSCQYSVHYTNVRRVNCIETWRNSHSGANPPEELCGAGLVYDIDSVSATDPACPLEGQVLEEKVTADRGCTVIPFQWKEGSCVIGPGGKLTACQDVYSLCMPPRATQFVDGCTEVLTQKTLIGGQLAETHTITFDLDRNAQGGCKGSVSRT
jgi:hypothetical protein